MSIFWDDISYNQECKVFINISGGFIVMNWKIIGINLYLCSLSYFFSQSINFFFKETFVSFIQKVLAEEQDVFVFQKPSMYLAKLCSIIVYGLFALSTCLLESIRLRSVCYSYRSP